MLFFRYFPPKNSSIEQLFNDFLKENSEKTAIPYKHFLKKDKSNTIFLTQLFDFAIIPIYEIK